MDGCITFLTQINCPFQESGGKKKDQIKFGVQFKDEVEGERPFTIDNGQVFREELGSPRRGRSADEEKRRVLARSHFKGWKSFYK